jgi:hypothetical protein
VKVPLPFVILRREAPEDLVFRRQISPNSHNEILRVAALAQNECVVAGSPARVQGICKDPEIIPSHL